MNEKCREVQDAIALEGRTPEEEDARKHANECAECARFLKSVLAVENELSQLEADDVSDVVVQKLLARTELTRAQRARWIGQWALGTAAVILISVVAASLTPVWNSRYYEGVGAAETPYPGGVPVDTPELTPELTEEQRRNLSALGYIASGYAETEPDMEEEPALEGNRVTGDKVVRREMFLDEAEVKQREKLARQIQELNRQDYYRAVDELELDDSKNEALKKDYGEGSGSRTRKIGNLELDSAANQLKPKAAAKDDAFGDAGSKRSADQQGAGRYSQGEAPQPPEPSPGTAGSFERRADSRDADAQFGNGRLQSELQQIQEGLAAATGPEPDKRVHVDPVFPNGVERPVETPEVELRIVVDRDGNVARAEVVGPASPFDQAALDAARQWKYDVRDVQAFLVTVRFEPPSEPNDAEAAAFLAERDRIDGLRFRNPRGYWANTYLPGDPAVRLLEMRLKKAEHFTRPHIGARPIDQPLDAPMRGALSLSVHADRRGITERTRLLVQVGIQATEDHGRRRPPMSVGIVLDADTENEVAMRALVTALGQSKEIGDRFRLFIPGQGQVVRPESFRHGALTVALDEAMPGGSVEDAFRLAVENVHAGDDPTMPLGSSLVLLVTGRSLEDDTLAGIAHRSAVGGVPVSVVGIGSAIDKESLERLALAGQGRRYFLEQPADAANVVDRELSASSRVVARALRLRIKLAEGVELVDVVGSRSLSERQAEQVREAEKSIDLRLSRNLGIEADRGEDEDGIQVVIPSFYAGDVHTILLDVVVPRSGAVADVTARYKDLVELENTVSRASLSLPRTTAARGPIETSVLKSYLAHHLSRQLEAAADALEHGERDRAVGTLASARQLLAGLRMQGDREIAADIAMLNEYVRMLTSSTEPALHAYLADSLRYAGASKRGLPRALT